MAIQEAFSGSATIGTTETSLVSGTTTLQNNTTDGIYQIWIDFSNMLAGDEYEIDIKEKVTSAGTQRNIFQSYIEGRQSSPFVTPTLIFLHGWDVTVTKITGTDRVITWSIRQVA
jgi:hypothetical protein